MENQTEYWFGAEESSLPVSTKQRVRLPATLSTAEERRGNASQFRRLADDARPQTAHTTAFLFSPARFVLMVAVRLHFPT